MKRTPNHDRMEGLVTVAAQLFAQKGFGETTVAELTQAMGLQRGGLYHYIESKEDLLFAIHERAQAPLLQRVLEIEGRGLPPDRALRELAHAMIFVIEHYQDEVIVFFSEWRKINDDSKWESVRRTRRRIESVFHDVLERGEKEGIFAFADRRIASIGFIGMLNYTSQWFDARGRLDAHQIAEHFTDMFLEGIRTKDVPDGGTGNSSALDGVRAGSRLAPSSTTPFPDRRT